MTKPNSPLKNAVKDYFDDVNLSSDELRSLRQLEAEASASTPPSFNRRHFLAAAASISALSLSGGIIWNRQRAGKPVDRMFSEIASVHLAKMPLNFQASSIEELGDAFAPQGFLVRESPPLQEIAGAMEGGRFCWLLKQAAAEFRYQLSSGGWATVIQTAYKPEVFGKLPDIAHGKTPITRFVRGLECWIWCDRGMVYAQAKPA